MLREAGELLRPLTTLRMHGKPLDSGVFGWTYMGLWGWYAPFVNSTRVEA